MVRKKQVPGVRFWALMFLLATGAWHPTAALAQSVNTPIANLNNVRHASAFPGATADVKISNCIADLPAGGGTCDARGLTGAQTASAAVVITKPLHLILGAMTLTGPPAGNLFQANGVSGIDIEGSRELTFLNQNAKGGAQLLAFKNVTHLTVQNLNMVGSESARTSTLDTAVYITSANGARSAIGDNKNVTIDHVHFKNWGGFGTYIWFTQNFWFEANECDATGGCLQAYNNADVHVNGNTVDGQISGSAFASLIAINSVGCGGIVGGVCQGGVGSTPTYHNQRVEIHGNTISNGTYGQSILLHDCSSCSVIGNRVRNARSSIVLGPAPNFNQVIENVDITGNIIQGSITGTVTSAVGNAGITVSGDNTAHAIWAASTNYAAPTNNTCVNAGGSGRITCVVPTTASTLVHQQFLFQVQSCTGSCTSGSTEPAWPAGLGQTVGDNQVAWVNIGRFKATNVAVMENTIEHTGYIEAVAHVGACIQVNGASDGLLIIGNVCSDASGAGIFMMFTNSHLKVEGNTITHLVLNPWLRNQAHGIYFMDAATTIIDGEIKNNFLDDATTAIFARITRGNMAKTLISQNHYGPNLTSHPLDLAGTASLGPTTIQALNVPAGSNPAPVTVVGPTSAIAAHSCATTITTGFQGALNSSKIVATPNADPAVAGYGKLIVIWYPTADNVNLEVCNPTAGSVTPTALTFNVSVVN
jgi:hypothetical protein